MGSALIFYESQQTTTSCKCCYLPPSTATLPWTWLSSLEDGDNSLPIIYVFKELPAMLWGLHNHLPQSQNLPQLLPCTHTTGSSPNKNQVYSRCWMREYGANVMAGCNISYDHFLYPYLLLFVVSPLLLYVGHGSALRIRGTSSMFLSTVIRCLPGAKRINHRPLKHNMQLL